MPPEAYARFMGRYAEPLAGVFVAFAGIGAGDAPEGDAIEGAGSRSLSTPKPLKRRSPNRPS